MIEFYLVVMTEVLETMAEGKSMGGYNIADYVSAHPTLEEAQKRAKDVDEWHDAGCRILKVVP